MTALTAILWLLPYSLLLGTIGYLPARWFFERDPIAGEDKTRSRMILVAALLLGPVCFTLVLFLLSLMFQTGISFLSKALLAVMLLPLPVALIMQPRIRRDLFESCARARWFLFVLMLIVLPLCGLYILVPMGRHAWLMDYSVGNDAVRYVLMIEYLQHHSWHWGTLAVSGPPMANFYPLASRPLMHYFMAETASLLPIGPYLAYSVSSLQASFLLVLSIVGLGRALFRRLNLVTPVIIAAAVGTAGFFTSQYYAGSLGQCFAPATVLMLLWYLFFEDFGRLLAWFVISSFASVLTYTSGMFLISFGILSVTEGVRVLCRGQSVKGACRIALIALCVGLVAMQFGDSAIGNYQGYNGRNEAYNYGLRNGTLIWFGLASKYMDLRSYNWRQLLTLFLPLALLAAFALSCAVRTLKENGRYAGILFGYWGVMAAAYWRGEYFFFTKLFPPAVPLLFVSVAAAGWENRKRGRDRLLHSYPTLALGAGLLGLSLLGWRLTGYYASMAEDRQTYVTSSILETRNELVSGRGQLHIFADDGSPERHLLIRQLFPEALWWPARDDVIWGEFNLNDRNAPPELRTGRYDLLISAHDFRGPVDYRRLDSKSLIGSFGPLVDVFGAGSLIVQFDHAWSPGPAWRKLEEPKQYARGMSLEDRREGTVVLRVQGQPSDIRIQIGSQTENKITLFLNGVQTGPPLPLEAGGQAMVSLMCSKLCRFGENTLRWEQTGKSLELMNLD